MKSFYDAIKDDNHYCHEVNVQLRKETRYPRLELDEIN